MRNVNVNSQLYHQNLLLSITNPSVMMTYAMSNNAGVVNGTFRYIGNPIGLEIRLQDIAKNSTPVSEAIIYIAGRQIKQQNGCCIFSTIIAGSFCIIPLCFMCCSWWKKISYPAYQIPPSTYQSLSVLTSNPNIQSITLIVSDNAFGLHKSQILFNLLSKSQIKGFTFMNFAHEFNLNENQFSNFIENMKPIKILPISSEIKWDNKIVL